MRTLTLGLLVALTSADPPCTDADLRTLGSVSTISNTVTSCYAPDKPRDQISECIMSQIPGILTVSQSCILCTIGVFDATSEDCNTACEADVNSAACKTCITSFQSTWTSVCDSNGSISASLSTSVLLVILYVLV
jgi:hypothetical protein